MQSLFGTAYYIAPEVIARNYNEKCDEWSIGVILFILLTGKPPFNGKNDEEIMENITKGKFNRSLLDPITTTAKDLIMSLMSTDIKRRISAEDAL